MEECPVCLAPLTGSLTTVGCCRKQFHTGCLLKCVEQKNECPMCRAQHLIQVPEVVIPVMSYEEEVFVTRQKIIVYTMCGILFVTSIVIVIKIW